MTDRSPSSWTAVQKHDALAMSDRAGPRASGRQQDNKPQTPDEIQFVGDCHLAQGEWEQAIKNYRDAVAKDQANPDRRIRLGDAYALTENATKALSQYKHAIKTSP